MDLDGCAFAFSIMLSGMLLSLGTAYLYVEFLM